MRTFLSNILILTALFILGASARVSAQEVEAAVPQVSLLTVEPGPIIYELDGHTALRFSLPGQYDYIVNWGVFDFNSPNFLYRFVKGETDYMAYPFPYELFFEEYKRQGRGMTEQVLNLTPQQIRILEELVKENLKPENRTYRYNYIYDNCATRPLALIEKAVGAQVEIPDVPGFVYGETGIADDGSPTTFRREMSRTHADYPWYQFGIDLALGSGLDKEISPRERTYSPLYLRHALQNATYTDSLGHHLKLVSSTSSVLPGRKVTLAPTPWYLTPRFIALLIALLTAWIVLRDLGRMKVSRWYDSLFYSILLIPGLLLTFLIFVSVHEATSPNWLYLWLNPFCAIPAFFIWIKSCRRVVYCYQICNFVALFLLLLIGIFGVQRFNSAFNMLIGADMLLSARYLILNNHKLINILTSRRDR